MGDQWSFRPGDQYKSTHRLIHLLVDVVGKGGNFLLNVGPQPDGQLPAKAVERMREIGDWLDVNGEAIYGPRRSRSPKAWRVWAGASSFTCPARSMLRPRRSTGHSPGFRRISPNSSAATRSSSVPMRTSSGATWTDGGSTDATNGTASTTALTTGQTGLRRPAPAIRTPWLAYWKGTIPGGQAYPHPVISLDVAATAVALAGLKTQPGELDGVNLMPFFTGQNKSAPHERLYWRWTAQSAIREGRWKLLRGGPREYLFDLAADPGEKQNLLAKHPDIASRLRDQLKAWGADLQPPGVDSASLGIAAANYFDYYLDGKPAGQPVPAQESEDRAARREERKKRRQSP